MQQAINGDHSRADRGLHGEHHIALQFHELADERKVLVAVGNDPEKANNGLYMLADVGNIDSLSSWVKFAELSDLEAMSTNIQILSEELGLVKAELDKKQDKLTAGKNIIIENKLNYEFNENERKKLVYLSSMRYTDNSFEKTEHSLEYIKE